MIQICTLGGYDEIGKNMTAVRVDDEVVVFDMGVHLEPYIATQQETDDVDAVALRKAGAIPDIRPIHDWISLVKCIVPTHAHLDHVAGIPYLAWKFDAPIICTPYTAQVIEAIAENGLSNKIKVLNENSRLKISDALTLEFVRVTHSIPQTVIAVLHTPYGAVVYANDFKLDMHPVLGKKSDTDRLKQIGEEGVAALICDSTNADKEGKTPSEEIARDMLRDVMLSHAVENKALIVTTFSSHLARIKSIIHYAKQLGRDIMFVGRSMHKYITAGENINLVRYSEEGEIVAFSGKIERKLKKVMLSGKERYVLIVTGHQGEEGAILSRMVDEQTPFIFDEGDVVVFSSPTIPTETNIANRAALEEKLEGKKVRLFKDIHVSGHAAREDLRDLLLMLKPKNLIPAHGFREKREALASLGEEMGLATGETIFLCNNGDSVEIIP